MLQRTTLSFDKSCIVAVLRDTLFFRRTSNVDQICADSFTSPVKHLYDDVFTGSPLVENKQRMITQSINHIVSYMK